MINTIDSKLPVTPAPRESKYYKCEYACAFLRYLLMIKVSIDSELISVVKTYHLSRSPLPKDQVGLASFSLFCSPRHNPVVPNTATKHHPKQWKGGRVYLAHSLKVHSPSWWGWEVGVAAGRRHSDWNNEVASHITSTVRKQREMLGLSSLSPCYSA